MRRRALVGAGAAAAILAGLWVFARDTVPKSIWADAERGDLVLSVEVTGVLAAVNSTPIGPPQLPDSWDFKIAMMAPEGTDVRAGTPVLGFDTSELERKLLEKRAESESAAKRIEKKEKDAEMARKNDELRLAEAVSRQKKSALELEVPEELVKSQQLKEARLNLEDADREIEFLNARLAALRHADDVALSALRAQKGAADRRVQEIQASIEAMAVKAPRGGTVVYATSWRDEKKKVGDSAWRGERILEIPDLSEMKGEGEVDESDAGKIAVGQTVRFKLEAHPDLEFTGKISSILSTVQRQSWRSPVKVVKLVVALAATDPRKMRPGMRFRGTVETARIAGTLLVPADAVFPTASGPVAFRKTAVGYARKPLILGARNETVVEVKAGLDAGDRVARRDLDADAQEIPLKRRGVVVLCAGVAGVVLVASPWIGHWGDRSGVPTLVVAAEPFARRVVAEGNLEAAEATPVTAPVDAQGQLKVAWLVPDGSPVKKGDVVVRFDPSEMERSLNDGNSDRTSAESRIAGMRADTDGAIRNLERDASFAREELKAADRYKIDDPEVFSRQEIIRSQLDRNLATQRIETSDAVRTIRQDVAKVDLDLLDIERRKAGIAIDRASKGLDALEIKAPHDGILIYKRDWRGEITKVGDAVWPGEPVAEIPELKTMEARVFVLEADAGGLSKGIRATVTVEAHPATEYPAKIKKVDTLAKRRVGWIPVQYFGATLELDATDAAVMKPGQRVRAVLALDARPTAISIPRNAIFEKNGKKIVYKRAGAGFNATDVTLGPAAIGRVIVENGLSAGDEIALADPTAAQVDDGSPGSAGGSPTPLSSAR